MSTIKNIRLTNAIRSDIVSNICKSLKQNLVTGLGFKDEDALVNKIRELEKEALKEGWRQKYGKNLEYIQKISRELLNTREFVIFSSEAGAKHTLEEYPYIGKQQRGYDMVLTLEEYHELFQDYLKLAKSWEDIKAEVNSIISEARVILDSVNTTKQLIEVWETAENYIPAHIADPDKGSKLPAKLVSSLDERIKSMKI